MTRGAAMKDDLIGLAEQLEAKAKSARKAECSSDFHNYWRGYGEAMDEAAALIRYRASHQEQQND